jgi:hypothetical protein
MHTPYGPHKISQNRQLALPADMMRLARFEPGDSVYLLVNPDDPRTLLVVPVELAAAWFAEGRAQDQRQQQPAKDR